MRQTPEQMLYEKTVQLTRMEKALTEARDFLTRLIESRPKEARSILLHSAEELETKLNAALVVPK